MLATPRALQEAPKHSNRSTYFFFVLPGMDATYQSNRMEMTKINTSAHLEVLYMQYKYTHMTDSSMHISEKRVPHAREGVVNGCRNL